VVHAFAHGASVTAFGGAGERGGGRVVSIETAEQATPIGKIQRENTRTPTAADRAASEKTERDFFPAEYVNQGEPTHIDTPGYNAEAEVTAPVPVETPGAVIPPPPPSNGSADDDRDGLTTDQELQQGTSPQRADTDNDGLSDGDEIRQHRTDPLNPDSDGDSYLDGAEVRAGYNPNGPGAL
jgi:hypothetical protein